MTIQTPNLILVAHLPRHLRALARSEEEFENVAGLRAAGDIRDQLLSASAEFMTQLETAKQPDPWRFGFGVIHKSDNVLMGMGGFPGPPNDGVAEIAYGIAPAYREEVTQPNSPTCLSILSQPMNRSASFARTPFAKSMLPLEFLKNAVLKESPI